jgi:hypothetical protein
MFLEEKKENTTPVTLEPWRQLLLDAADVVRVHGHCKGAYQDDQYRVCVVGAIGVAAGLGAGWTGNFQITSGTHRALEACDRLHKFLGAAHIEWNDAPERTADEVMVGLRGAARQAI